MSDRFQVFLNKEIRSKQKCSNKQTLISSLFKSSPWFLRLKGASLNSEAPKETAPKSTDSEKSPVKKAPALEVKPKADTSKINLNDSLKETSSTKIPLGDSSLESESESLELRDISFEESLKSFNDNWSINDIPGIESRAEGLKIIFYGLDEISSAQGLDFPPISLIESDSDLLGKMIGAMGLKTGDFARLPILGDEQRQNIESLIAAVKFFKPSMIVPLGAKATTILAGKKVKLSGIHGQIFKKSFISGEEIFIQYCPLFHPELLEINQSMKRTAWNDMKFILSELEK